MRKKAITELGNAVAMAGIGHPPRFFNSLQDKGLKLRLKPLTIIVNIPYKVTNTDASPRALIMTEKDAVKCQHFARNNCGGICLSVR